MNMNSNLRTGIVAISLFIILLSPILLISAPGVSAQDPNNTSLSVSRATYVLGETVCITLVAAQEEIVFFNIISPEGIFYAALPSTDREYKFKPNIAGTYAVNVLLRAGGDEKFLTTGFEVMDMGPEVVFGEPEQRGIVVGEPVNWSQQISITNHERFPISNFSVSIPLPAGHSNLSSDAGFTIIDSSILLDLAADEDVSFNILYQTPPVWLEVVGGDVDIYDLIPPDAFDIGLYKQIGAEDVSSPSLSTPIGMRVKRVKVWHNSSTHYRDIPITIAMEEGERLFEIVDGTEMEVSVDIADGTASWTIPELSNRTFMMMRLDRRHGDAEIDKPVEWQLNVSGTIIRYRTPAPYRIEREEALVNGMWRKDIIVGSNASVHYRDVTAFTTLNETAGSNIKLFLLENGLRVDVTDDPAYNVSLSDRNGNSISDEIRWNVPLLSNRTFGVEINITKKRPPGLTAKQKHFSFDEKPEFIFEYISEEEFRAGKAEAAVPKPRKAMGALVTGKRTIKPFVYNSEGELTDIEPEIEELREGKISITIPAKRAFRAGIYTLQVEFVKDGVTYTQEQEFQWGLVSLNTRKSIYKPGEVAEFIIVVLDKYGHPVCNADISMTVANPGDAETVYSTGDGTILPGSECGVFNAMYPTEIEGNHILDITAMVDGVEVSFDTYFLIQQEYEFDIIRTAKSKIDPTKQDRFYVKLDIESFTGDSAVTIKEFVPAEFDVSPADAATVLLEDDTKTITWNKDLIGNKTSVSYSYSVPHVWPYLYALGPVEIDYFDETFSKSSTFKEARPWYVAVDPSFPTKGMIAYGEGTVTTPRYRLWSGTGWGSEQSANNVGGVTNIVVLRSAKTKNEKILGVLDKYGHINVQVWNGSAWGTVLEVTTAIGTTNDDYRGFDIAYEDSSGDAIIVYQNNVNDPLYRVWNGTGWSDAVTLDLPTAGIPVQIRLKSKPGADEIIVATLDLGKDVTAAVWDGSAWGNSINLEGAAYTYTKRCFAIAYESTSGDAMVAWSDGGVSLGGPQYRFWNGTAWGAEATAPQTGDRQEFIDLGSDPLSDKIVMGAMGTATTPNIDVNVWNGSAWGTNLEATTSGVGGNRKAADVGFESTSGEAMAVYAVKSQECLYYRNWSAGTWSNALSGHDLGSEPQTGDGRPDPNSDDAIITIVDKNNYLKVAKWNGSAEGTPETLETTISSTFVSFMFSYDRYFPAPVVQTPSTYDNITMAAKTTFHRNDGMTVRVNVTDENGRDDIDKVLIKILNTTSVVKVDNATMTSITQIPNGYTYEYNYTIPSDADAGTWTINVYANDTLNAWDSNTTTFDVYGYSNVTWVSPPDESSYEVGETITLTCLVRDANTSSGIENYPVRFYNKTDSTVTYIGLNYTNSSGYAVMDWDTTGVTAGWYYPKCNISDNSTLFYTVTADNEANTSVELSHTTTLEIKNQTNVTAIGSINFSGVSGDTVSNPYNNVDGSGSPQDITSKTPVVTIYNPSSSTNYKIWLKVTDGTGWDNIISDEKFNVTADGVCPGDVSSWATLTSWGSYKDSGVTVAAGTHKDLYLTFYLKGSGTGSSTLSVLGEGV